MRKLKITRLICMAMAVLLLLCLVSCGNSAKSNAYDGDVYDESADMIPGGTADFGTLSGENTAIKTSDRKLVRDSQLSLETKQFDKFVSQFKKDIETAGGYIEGEMTDGDKVDSMRSADYTVRIPAEKLDGFLSDVSSIATVTSQSTHVKDVTDVYVDSESRLKALEAEYESLLKLLDKATTLSDIMSIRDRITEVNGEIESYKARLKLMDSEIQYSTVRVYVYEVEHITEMGVGFWSQAGANIADNFRKIGKGLKSVAMFVLSAIPYLLLIGVVLVVALIIVKCNRRVKARKKEKKPNEIPADR